MKKHLFLAGLLASQFAFAQFTLVKDIRPGATGSILGELRVFQGSLVFKANDYVIGSELYKSDGTGAGTVPVADKNPGSASFNPSNMVEFNNKLYFTGLTAAEGNEIFYYDGSSINLAADIKPGNGSIAASNLIVFKNNLYFRGQESNSLLYRYYKMAPDNSYSIISPTIFSGLTSAVLGSQLLMAAGTLANNMQLYTSTGNEVTLLKTINPGGSGQVTNMFVSPTLNKVLFSANDGTNGRELWVTDGTEAGTKMLADITQARQKASRQNFMNLTGRFSLKPLPAQIQNCM